MRKLIAKPSTPAFSEETEDGQINGIKPKLLVRMLSLNLPA
jgi:hypothetical protein